MPASFIHSLSAPSGPVRAILYGGLTAGALDIVYAIVASGLRGVPAARVLQSVASGLLGPAAYRGGTATAAFGLTLHFLMTILMAAIFVATARRLPWLIERPLLWGVLYGVGIYCVMNYVVLPLSAFPAKGGSPSLAMLLGGLAIHAFGVGLPIALFARRFAVAPA